jgi:hypothetical protein
LLDGSDCDCGQLDVVLLAVQRSLGLALHGDDASRPCYLELEVGVFRDGHELDITWPSQDDVVGSGEVDHLKGDCLSAVVACISKSDEHNDLPEWDGLLAHGHFIERLPAGLE